MTPQQRAHALISYYEKKYVEKYEKKPKMNRHAARWGFGDILQDVPDVRAKELVDFYFLTTSSNGHALNWFLYHYEELLQSLEDKERDRAHRERLRRQTEQRTKEYLAKYGDKRSATD